MFVRDREDRGERERAREREAVLRDARSGGGREIERGSKREKEGAREREREIAT